jgi:3-oxoacyl-[acyl-carrier protein] reductase
MTAQPLDLMDLRGRHVLVTGAGRGIGRTVALLLATHGAGTVVVNDLFEDRAEAVAGEIRELGGSALAARADITDRGDVVTLAARLEELDRPVQILVNNAGLPPGPVDQRPFAETTPEMWDPMIRLNLYGLLHVTHTVITPMITSGWGRVITMISDSSRTGDPYQSIYAAAKAGAAGFTRSLASEVGKLGVTANCISLSSVRTGDRGGKEPDAKRLARYPLRRLGTPDDVAPAVLFLASDASAWITGQVIPVNGGYSYTL